jgi:hypothetical protein
MRESILARVPHNGGFRTRLSQCPFPGPLRPGAATLIYMSNRSIIREMQNATSAVTRTNPIFPWLRNTNTGPFHEPACDESLASHNPSFRSALMQIKDTLPDYVNGDFADETRAPVEFTFSGMP